MFPYSYCPLMCLTIARESSTAGPDEEGYWRHRFEFYFVHSAAGAKRFKPNVASEKMAITMNWAMRAWRNPVAN